MLFKKLCIPLLTALVLSGCTIGEKKSIANNEEPVILELQQNDYRGGLTRMLAVEDAVLKIVSDMKANNAIVRSENPNSYWDKSEYDDFVSTFLESPLIEDTIYLNEEQTSWEYVTSYISTHPNSFTRLDSNGSYILKDSATTFSRLEKDEYIISGFSYKWNNITVYPSYRCLYDCDKDWCKAVVSFSLGDNYPTLTLDMLEYGRIDNNSFAVQTKTERLLVVLEPVKEDISLEKRKVKEVYYSKLSGGIRTEFEPYEYLPEYDEFNNYLSENKDKNATFAKYINVFNEKGDFSTQYNASDSIFLDKTDIKDLSPDWVFEDKALFQTVIYKEQTLVVSTYNKLTEKYEQFIYVGEKVDESLIESLCDLVKIGELVGYNEEAVKKQEEERPHVDGGGNEIQESDEDYNLYPEVSPTPLPTQSLEVTPTPEVTEGTSVPFDE